MLEFDEPEPLEDELPEPEFELPEFEDEPLLPEEPEFELEESPLELLESVELEESELDEPALEESLESDELPLPLAADCSFAFSLEAEPLSVASCFVCAVSVAVNIGSVLVPMPLPAVNTWISTAETAMAMSAETMDTIITLRCTFALRRRRAWARCTAGSAPLPAARVW